EVSAFVVFRTVFASRALLEQQQTLADGQQHPLEVLPLGDAIEQSSGCLRARAAVDGIGHRALEQRLVDDEETVCVEQPQRRLDHAFEGARLRVDEDHVIGRGGELLEHLLGATVHQPQPSRAIPAISTRSRAAPWAVEFVSIEVSIPAVGIPRSRASVDVPTPVPTSTAATGVSSLASRVSVDAVVCETGTSPNSCECVRAASSSGSGPLYCSEKVRSPAFSRDNRPSPSADGCSQV